MKTSRAQSASTSEAPRAFPGVLGFAGAFFLGAVLLFAAWAKLLDPLSFVEQIRTEGLDFLIPAAPVAFAALGLEVFLGVALVLGLRRRWILVLTTLLVAFFVFLTGRNYYLVSHGLREEGADCGCFGKLVESTPAQAFYRDMLLLVPPLAFAWLGRAWGSRRKVAPRLAVAALATVAALAFAWKAPDLPLDNLATALKPGVLLSETCAGGEDNRACLDDVVLELAQGEHLVVMAELTSEELVAAVASLNAYSDARREPPLWVLAPTDEQGIRTFYWQHGPSFEIREAPAPLLGRLYRTLPRSFRVRDGKVEETWSGLPPALDTTAVPEPGTE